MYSVCLLFSGRRGLDDFSIRASILRIPEVSRKINHAQNIIEKAGGKNPSQLDLISYLLSSDQEFESKTKLKSLLTSIVQIGLFDRFVKYRSRPHFLIGQLNETSAMKVCADKQSFSDLIYESDFFKELQNIKTISPQPLFLSGNPLEEYGTFAWNTDGFYQTIESPSKEASILVAELFNENKIQQCIHIGPHYQFRLTEFEKWGLDSIPSMSSIDLDPILNSFWRTA